jgi:hypothetical protein
MIAAMPMVKPLTTASGTRAHQPPRAKQPRQDRAGAPQEGRGHQPVDPMRGDHARHDHDEGARGPADLPRLPPKGEIRKPATTAVTSPLRRRRPRGDGDGRRQRYRHHRHGDPRPGGPPGLAPDLAPERSSRSWAAETRNPRWARRPPINIDSHPGRRQPGLPPHGKATCPSLPHCGGNAPNEAVMPPFTPKALRPTSATTQRAA